jgi:hypothetical protein
MDGTMSSVARGTGWGVEKARGVWELMMGVGLEEEELMMVVGRIEAAGAGRVLSRDEPGGHT